MIIDTHTHIWPEKIAAKAKEYLEKLFDTRLVTLPVLENLLRFMDRNGVDISFIASVASRPDQMGPINKWLFSIRNERIRIFASFHPDAQNWQDELKRIRDHSSGIKLQPEFQDFFADDEKLFPAYEKMSEYSIPVLFHCGEELSGTMLVRSSPDRISRLNNKFPGLKIIAAHFGGFRKWGEVEKHLIGKDIYLDTSFTFNHLKKENLIKMINNHSKERILFGTDFPLTDQKKDIDYLNNLEIEEEFRKKIFYKNAAKLFGIKAD